MKNLTCLALCMFAFFGAYTQTPSELKYRRSSLYTLMIADSSYEHAQVISDAFIKYPVPDKFNDHNLSSRIINLKPSAADQQVKITNYTNTNAVAKSLVAKWFNRSASGSFNMDLVAERGSYNASEMDANVAKLSKRGVAMLADAGEELINNTFVLVSDFKYVPDSVILEKAKKVSSSAKDINKVASRIGSKFGLPGGNTGSLISSADNAIEAAENSDGYVVVATSYLFRLHWDDSVAAVFYNDYWCDKNSISSAKKTAFDASTIFTLDFIGKDQAWATVQSFKLLNKSEEVLIAKATVNALDAVIAKLQHTYEVFRTKVPLLTTDPYSAQIGMKEGLQANDRFEVLEQTQDEDGRTHYVSVGSLTVDKKQIWDNRYMAEADSASTIDRTLFKGGNKKIYPGMLIKQK